MPFNLIEPHPSVPKTTSKKANLSTGRGGAGNFSSHSPSSLTEGPTASGPASRLSSSSKASKTPSYTTTTTSVAPQPSRAKYSSGGIGGAGNFVPSSERRMFSFDEELERQRRMDDARSSTPVYHFGRGGAGNLAASNKARGSSSSSSHGSNASSAASVASSSDGAAARISGRFGKMVRALSTSRE